MCLLLFKPAGVEFTDEQLKDFHENNPDGFGIMYREDGKVVVHKRIGKLRKIRRMYRQYAAGRECALHFRWRTHGIVSRENTHPFTVRDGLHLMHNGILPHYSDAYGDKSDTALFCEDLARTEAEFPGVVSRDAYLERIGEMIGDSNKLILLDATEGFKIVNEGTGRWYQGAWYSNDYAWDSPFSYSMGYSAAWGRWKDYTGALVRGSAEDWENDPRIAAPDMRDEDASSVYDLAVDGDEQEALDDLIGWLRATSCQRARDYAVEMIAGNYADSERIASFLWEVFEYAVAEVQAEMEAEADAGEAFAERVLSRHGERYAG